MKTISFIAVAIALLFTVEGRTVFMPTAFKYEGLNFEGWATRHGKHYDSSLERNLRKSIWEKNVGIIREHNDNSRSTFWLDENEHADLTGDEYRRVLLGSTKPPEHRRFLFSHAPPAQQLPPAVDWRKQHIVTGVKNQGQCGSCWAFSATGAIEGQFARRAGHLVSLSEQQLVDCSSSYGNLGCSGGLMNNAFNYTRDFGIEGEEDYRYEGVEGNCRYNESLIVTVVEGYADIKKGSELGLTSAIATVGPVSVAIDASHYSFQFYGGGVYNELNCSSTELDHGVLAIGYGTAGGKRFYWVKNSWGTSWGEGGYIRMSRNKRNQCGIATAASYPVL